MSEAEQLVEQLASIAIEDCFADPVRLLAAMTERQALLTKLQNTDTSTLTDEQRVRFQARLNAVLIRNEELLVQVGQRLDETRKAMEQLAPGRTAVRRYAESLVTVTPPQRRIG
jgi:hypothetical protein